MKNKEPFGVFYVNEITGEKVPFKHAIPVYFNKKEAEQFVKDMAFDRWFCNATPYSNSWKMVSLPLT